MLAENIEDVFWSFALIAAVVFGKFPECAVVGGLRVTVRDAKEFEFGVEDLDLVLRTAHNKVRLTATSNLPLGFQSA